MILQAKAASSLVLSALNSGLRRGRIHSCYRRTINVLCDDMFWLSLHPVGVPLHPYCVVVDACGWPWASSPSSQHGRFLDVEPGASASLSETHITIGGGGVTIDLRRAQTWPSRLTALSGSLMPGSLEACEALWDLASQMPTDSWFMASILTRARARPRTSKWAPVIVLRTADQVLGALSQAWRSRSLGSAIRALGDLIGLGPGLTPSGDDFLMGFLGASYLFAHDDEFRRAVFDRAGLLIHRTTLPSFFMLRAALEGHYPEPLSSLLLRLGRGEIRGLRQAADRLDGIGATSGHDMLAGVLLWSRIFRDDGVTGVSGITIISGATHETHSH